MLATWFLARCILKHVGRAEQAQALPAASSAWASAFQLLDEIHRLLEWGSKQGSQAIHLQKPVFMGDVCSDVCYWDIGCLHLCFIRVWLVLIWECLQLSPILCTIWITDFLLTSSLCFHCLHYLALHATSISEEKSNLKGESFLPSPFCASTCCWCMNAGKCCCEDFTREMWGKLLLLAMGLIAASVPKLNSQTYTPSKTFTNHYCRELIITSISPCKETFFIPCYKF